MKVFAISVIMCALLGLGFVNSENPACPFIDCPRVSTVGCFLTEERCQCFCVEREDPCEYVVRNYESTCRANQFMHCISDNDACKCHCVLK